MLVVMMLRRLGGCFDGLRAAVTVDFVDFAAGFSFLGWMDLGRLEPVDMANLKKDVGRGRSSHKV